MEGRTMEGQVYFYQVSFKCSLQIYYSFQQYSIREMVAVSSEGGSDIGFISREVSPDEIQLLILEGKVPSRRILSNINDSDDTIRNMLTEKIFIAAKYYAKCQEILRGHRSNSFLEVYATSCRFDKKELFVYLKRCEQYSYCRLVRKLFVSLKMKITVVECDSDVLRECGEKYLSLSGFDATLPALVPGLFDTSPSSYAGISDYSPHLRPLHHELSAPPDNAHISRLSSCSSFLSSSAENGMTDQTRYPSRAMFQENDSFSLGLGKSSLPK